THGPPSVSFLPAILLSVDRGPGGGMVMGSIYQDIVFRNIQRPGHLCPDPCCSRFSRVDQIPLDQHDFLITFAHDQRPGVYRVTDLWIWVPGHPVLYLNIRCYTLACNTNTQVAAVPA